MTELLNADLLGELFNLFGQSVVAGIAISCIATALSWAIITVLKLLHKIF